MNKKFLASCGALGLAGLSGLAAAEVQARSLPFGLAAEAHDLAVASSASRQSSLRPDLLIASGKIGGITLTEHELVRSFKVATKFTRDR